jgi:hypothetical protein
MHPIDRAATAEDVNEMLGEIDPLAMERLLALGASVMEIASAIHAIDHEADLELPREAHSQATCLRAARTSPAPSPSPGRHVCRQLQ